jgi:ABC-2 type transport system ATP-binding protein
VLAIDAAALAKTYTRWPRRAAIQALGGVDLTVPRGIAFGLLGPNGAGKTTFVKILLSVVRPTAGRVRALGGDPADPRTRARIGYLPEQLHLPLAWRPPEFLASVARLKGVATPAGALARLLARVGLTADAQRTIGTFSKGMRQRLGLAAALLGDPDLLVLDEPTDGIDPLGRMDVRRILAEERSRGATIFVNSHLLAETERLCDRIGILSHGRLVREGRLEDLLRSGTGWEVRFAPGAAAAALAAAGFAPAGGPDRYRCDAADPAAMNLALDRARAAGALVVELGREARDLEAVFADAVQERA